MCICGGILEVGFVGAIIGIIGKKIHKCHCVCHEDKNKPHTCNHCIVHQYSNKGHKKYNIIQLIFKFIVILSIAAISFGVFYQCYSHNCDEHCHHTEMKK